MLNVVIPAYNCSKTIENTLNSLVSQTKKMFLVTIVDDASTEEIYPIIEKFENSLKIKYIKLRENGGPGRARQIGTDAQPMCNSVMFIDADDILYPRAIEALSHELVVTGADVVYSDIFVESDSHVGKVLQLGDNTTWTHGKIYSTDFLNRFDIKFLNEKIYNEDSYFNLVVNLLSKKKAYLKEVTYLWKNNPESITRKLKGEFNRKHAADYLYAQICALIKVLSIEYNEQIGLTLGEIYNSYQFCSLLKISMTHIIPMLNTLSKNKNFKKYINLINKNKTYGLIMSRTMQGRVFSGEIYFYKQTLGEWIKEFFDADICS